MMRTALGALALACSASVYSGCSSDDDSAAGPPYVRQVQRWECCDVGTEFCDCTGLAGAGDELVCSGMGSSCPQTECCIVSYDAEFEEWVCACLPTTEMCPTPNEETVFRVASCPP